MKKKSIVAIFLAGITLSAFQVQASEPLELKKVMQELSRNMQIVTDGFSRENWKLVAEIAPAIAEHPQPPLAEKARIISFMGAEMSRFKAFDMQTHEAAHEMMHAAHEQNGQRVIDAFQKVQSSCLNCHQAFRTSFVKHFYGKSGE